MVVQSSTTSCRYFPIEFKTPFVQYIELEKNPCCEFNVKRFNFYLHYSFFVPCWVVISNMFRSIFLLANTKNDWCVTQTCKTTHKTKHVHIIWAAWQMLRAIKPFLTHRRLFSAVNFLPHKLRKKTRNSLKSLLTVARS